MSKIRLRLPTDSDLSMCSVQWAAELLGETPLRLWVTHEDDERARKVFGDLDIQIDETLECCAWVLEGETKEMYSAGA